MLTKIKTNDDIDILINIANNRGETMEDLIKEFKLPINIDDCGIEDKNIEINIINEEENKINENV